MEIIKKNCSLLMALITSFTAFLSLNQISAEECQIIDCRQQSVFCPQQICCDESPSGRFFVNADALYWKAHVSDLELAFGNSSIIQSITDGVQILTTDEFDEDPRFKWEAGYRVGGGYQFACSQWEIDASWTHFQSTGHRTDETSVIFNTGKCRLKLDQIDVVLAYNTSWEAGFNIKPFLGVRGTRIHESLHSHLITDITLSTGTLATETRVFDDKQNLRGIGPLFGLQADWHLGYGFSLYGTAAASVLYEKFKLHFDDTDVFSPPLSTQAFSTNNKHLHQFNCNIDLTLGISWQQRLFDAFELALKLGFEHHQYFNQNQLGSKRGDISFDGGIFSANVLF